MKAAVGGADPGRGEALADGVGDAAPPPGGEALDGVDGVSNLRIRGCQVRLHAPDTRCPQRIIEALEATGVAVSDVRVSAPDLEDVFLSLTGRSMREED